MVRMSRLVGRMAGMRPCLAVLFNVFAHSFFNDAASMSAAELAARERAAGPHAVRRAV